MRYGGSGVMTPAVDGTERCTTISRLGGAAPIVEPAVMTKTAFSTPATGTSPPFVSGRILKVMEIAASGV